MIALSTHIVSSCQSKEDPIGFQCPKCREFVPAPSFSLNVKNWSKHLPINKLQEDNLYKTETVTFCEACVRENEMEEADNYCLSCCEALCDICSKCHRKNLMSRDHKIRRLNELSKISTETPCTKHKDQPIQMFCNDYEELCCAMCCKNIHRICESVEPIEQKAEKIKSSASVGMLLHGIKEFDRKLYEAKQNQEKTITKLEDDTDALTGEVQSLKEKLIQNLEKLEKEYIDQIFRQRETCKQKLTKNMLYTQLMTEFF
ncbi:probable RING finger protein 207 homolog [Saccostrea cucullata]|uniref:probable RING finger protein 207 homolog n=1 Tax=Saccostrea cuccullata TaxID=36930 RepID=UPI002ED399A3